MRLFLRYFFLIIFIFSLYHLIRDILQTFGIHNSFTNIFHRQNTLWCGSFCNYVTYPLDLLEIAGSWIVLKRNKLGLIGAITIASLLFWLIAVLVP